MFGIRLPVNFRSPYKATSIIEFWRRWHITLSRFLRDYLYIPLGGNRLGEQRRYINLLVTMLLGGLWHGAAWNFLIWGGLHGIYLSVNHLWRGAREASAALWPRLLSWMLTFAAVVIAWVFFRAATVGGAWRGLKGLAGLQSERPFIPPDIVRVMNLPILVGAETSLRIGSLAVLVALAIALLLPNVPQIFRYREYRRAPDTTSLIQWKPTSIWAIAIGTAFAIALFGMWQRMEFLYFQF
jgi:D-alanyl-lipoteichoic acid acyltransferase DltB (MBOAT superfamily)